MRDFFKKDESHLTRRLDRGQRRDASRQRKFEGVPLDPGDTVFVVVLEIAHELIALFFGEGLQDKGARVVSGSFVIGLSGRGDKSVPIVGLRFLGRPFGTEKVDFNITAPFEKGNGRSQDMGPVNGKIFGSGLNVDLHDVAF